MDRQHRIKKNSVFKKITDICLIVTIVFVMSYEVTGDKWHEWVGIAGTFLVIVHMVLNRKWFLSVFKGKYSAIRIMTAVTDILLIASFLVTAFCGMAMSIYAVPFMYGIAPMTFVRRTHLAMSYWSFALAGIHLGLHAAVIAGMFKFSKAVKMIVTVFLVLAGIYGLYLIVTGRTIDYMLFKVPFAMIDAEKPKILLLFDAISMLSLFTCVGMGLGKVRRS